MSRRRKKEKPAGTDEAVAASEIAGEAKDVGSRGAEAPEPEQGREAVQAEVSDALSGRLLRLQADFDNFRKRTSRERAEIFGRANEQIMLELLPVLDHVELGLAAAREHSTDEAFVDGLRMVADQLLSALGKFGFTPIETSGGLFDPKVHEAISYIPTDDAEEGAIVTQTRKGYMLGEKLLRAAQVVVSSGAARRADADDEPDAPAGPTGMAECGD